MPTISKRKLESYKRAEVIARAMRYQISNTTYHNGRPMYPLSDSSILDMIINWMKVTGKIKYERPSD